MVIVMQFNGSSDQLEHVVKRVEELGFGAHVTKGSGKSIVGVIGDTTKIETTIFLALPGVEMVERVSSPYKLASRNPSGNGAVIRSNTTILVGDIIIGGEQVVIIAGPCAIESKEQLEVIAFDVKKAGANILRGGAFKPRTGPYNFQGLGEEGLKILQAVSGATGMPTITEVMNFQQVELAIEYEVGILQIGARNMQNFDLLKEVGRSGRPVMLKRGMSATIDELLLAAEYILLEGNGKVMLCERGIRSFDDKHSRNVLDVMAVPIIKKLSHLPIVVDPSHGTGRKDLVVPGAMAALAVGADGVMIEVHNDPENAKCDPQQALLPSEFKEFMVELKIGKGMQEQKKEPYAYSDVVCDNWGS